MPSSTPNDPSITRAAARWLARHDRGLTPREQQELTRWLDADERHAAAYGQMRSTWSSLDLARQAPDLAQMARELDEQTRARPLRRFPVWSPVLALAAAAALAVLVGVWQWRVPTPAPATEGVVTAKYRVIPDTVQRVILDDGSVAELRGSDSAIETAFTPTERRVQLLRGEAFFEVAKNPDRPFVVAAGRITVRAVGTAFNVQLDAGDLAVVVTEGRVAVLDEIEPTDGAPVRETAPLAPPLEAGQRARLTRETAAGAPLLVKVDALTAGELDELLAWQATWLVFDGTPLEDTIEAFNRYGSHHLVVLDDSLRSRQLTGKFRADNVEGFLRLLELTMNVKVDRRDGREIVLGSES